MKGLEYTDYLEFPFKDKIVCVDANTNKIKDKNVEFQNMTKLRVVKNMSFNLCKQNYCQNSLHKKSWMSIIV